MIKHENLESIKTNAEAVLRWEELSPGEWIFETEFGCLRVDAGKDYRSEGDAAFLAYWDWDETFEIGYFDTIEEAKEACMDDLERRVKPLAAYDRSLDCEHPDTIQLRACLNAANGANEDEDFKPGPEYIAVANLSDTFYQLRGAFERLCVDAAKRDPGYFYCEGPLISQCPWRKEGVHRCLAPEGYKYCQADFIDGVRTKNSTAPLCLKCNGKGWVRACDLGYGDSSKTCPVCHGKRICTEEAKPKNERALCPKCGGDGYIRLAGYGDDSRTCDRCKGEGKIDET